MAVIGKINLNNKGGRSLSFAFRTVQVLRDEEWRTIHFKSLLRGEYFKMKEPDGSQVVDSSGRDTFRTISKPYFCSDFEAWLIDIE